MLIIIFTGFTNFNSGKKEYKKDIALGKAKSIKTDITFTVGNLTLQTGSIILSEGVYKYYADKWKPNISYNEDSQSGYLKIESIDDRVNKNYDNSDQTDWDIRLNKNIANDLTIKMNAGVANINLQNSRLKQLDFEMAAGKVDINLQNTSVPILNFKAIAGEAIIDLSGEWQNSMDATIKGGIGELTVKLPSDIGIKLNIIGGLGDISAPKFKMVDNNFTNALFGKTKASLYLKIIGGIGDINIQMVD